MFQTGFQVGKIIKAPHKNFEKREFQIQRHLNSQTIYEAIPFNWSITNEVALYTYPLNVNKNLWSIFQQIKDYQKQYDNLQSTNCKPSRIIKIYDYFEFQNYLVIVMELGQLGLQNHLKQSQWNIQEKQSICIQILQSIKFLHDNNWIQLDIQPNIYTMVAKEVKLIHLKLYDLNNPHQPFFAIQFSNRSYQAPELFENLQQYPLQASNVWAVATIFYEIIKGEQLFRNHYIQSFDSFKTGPRYEIVCKINQLQISHQWKQTIIKMLQQKQNDRINIQQALENLSENDISYFQQKSVSQFLVNPNFQNDNLQISQIIQYFDQQLNNDQSQLPIASLYYLKKILKKLISKLNNKQHSNDKQNENKLVQVQNFQSQDEDAQIQKLKGEIADLEFKFLKMRNLDFETQNVINVLKDKLKEQSQMQIKYKEKVQEKERLNKQLKENYQPYEQKIQECEREIRELIAQIEIEKEEEIYFKKLQNEKSQLQQELKNYANLQLQIENLQKELKKLKIKKKTKQLEKQKLQCNQELKQFSTQEQ